MGTFLLILPIKGFRFQIRLHFLVDDLSSLLLQARSLRLVLGISEEVLLDGVGLHVLLLEEGVSVSGGLLLLTLLVLLISAV